MSDASPTHGGTRDDAVTPDGSPVAVYRALPARYGFEPVLDDLADRRVGTALDLGCGVGRLAGVLADAGVAVTGVDVAAAMLAEVDPRVRRVRAAIEGLDLGTRFDAVVLASHLVDDPAGRSAFLATVARHTAADGVAYVQHHDAASDDHRPGRVTTSTVTTDAGLLTVTTQVHARDGDRVRATTTMTLGGRRWAQTYEADLLDADALAAAVAAAGLTVDARLSPTWTRLRPA